MAFKSLSYDGFGINDRDDFRSRLTTFTAGVSESRRQELGELFAKAPEMAAALRDALELLDRSDVRDFIGRKLGEQAALHRFLNAARPLARGA